MNAILSHLQGFSYKLPNPWVGRLLSILFSGGGGGGGCLLEDLPYTFKYNTALTLELLRCNFDSRKRTPAINKCIDRDMCTHMYQPRYACHENVFEISICYITISSDLWSDLGKKINDGMYSYMACGCVDVWPAGAGGVHACVY